nr:MAG TPA: hypothetical protein [Caudoviricetes sp.]
MKQVCVKFKNLHAAALYKERCERKMLEENLTVLLFAFRYAVHRIPTQSLSAIQSELVTNLHRFPDWMLAQMERDLEWNFELMAMRKEERGTVGLDDDCEFQRPFLDAVKEQRRKLKEDNKCRQ